MTPDLERELVGAKVDFGSRLEIYSGVARLASTVWASEVRAAGSAPTTAVVVCHPTANFMGHYALPGLAQRGVAAVGMTTRYVGNDTSLILENCLVDIGAMVRHLYDERGYERVVLVGNSGGASIVPYYQAQALDPTVTDPPGGGPDLTEANLRPVDAICMLNAHPSRSRLSTEWLDPAIIDEARPFDRDPALDMFDPTNGPPYSAEFIARYRAAQLERNRRITRWAKAQRRLLASASQVPEGLEDMAFVVQGTAADLRFLDGDIDPSDREVGTTLWGSPQVANHLPAGISRVTTLRSWINQWSWDDTNGNALDWLGGITSPVLICSPTGDPTVLPHFGQEMYDAATASRARDLVVLQGANHYFTGQPEVLERALDAIGDWIHSTLGSR